MIDVDVSFLKKFQLIMMTTTTTIVHWVKILAKFQHVGDNR